MIDGICRTNLDGYKREIWPDKFVSVPNVGERVESMSHQSLRVCGITHTHLHKYVGEEEINIPGVLIELHK